MRLKWVTSLFAADRFCADCGADLRQLLEHKVAYAEVTPFGGVMFFGSITGSEFCPRS